MNTIELFGGLLRFDKYLIIIDIALIIHFIYDWYRMYKRTGWTLDYWTVSMSLIYFLPFLIIYPFSSSLYNAISVGGNVIRIQEVINECYIVFLAGYLSIYLGRYIFNKYKFNTPINYVLIRPFEKTLTKLFEVSVKNDFTSRILFLFYFIGLLGILAFGRQFGGNDIRAVFQANPEIRALYNFVLILSSVVSLVLIARIFQFNSLIDKILLGIFFLLTLFIGARAFLAQPIIYLFGFHVYYNLKGKINLIKVGITGCIVLVLGIGMSSVRAGELDTSLILAGLGDQILFGNSYSDLRDFAWVFAYWDHALLLGKTYLAGFMSFIPSFLSDFRTEWSIGKFTATTVGFDPLIHPGLRPGIFGEVFFNFGYLGVIILGVILGYGTRYIDFNIKVSSNSLNKLLGFSSIVSTFFIFNLTITAGFFSLYVFIIVLLLASILSISLKILSKR
ncbi:O-antigen polymerase [Pedobacter rhodius]|uniref:O-antigen ligase n=1 Tax=Pedobacter rhodius TaxID=3004098 RepID=A0ABT4KZN2_9SPHI|nr:O-antigen polymerase [Pedobacter sp. SJ11]MCZ4224377.1 O-antigen ligase [Pedobacter sp. SJ11]